MRPKLIGNCLAASDARIDTTELGNFAIHKSTTVILEIFTYHPGHGLNPALVSMVVKSDAITSGQHAPLVVVSPIGNIRPNADHPGQRTP